MAARYVQWSEAQVRPVLEGAGFTQVRVAGTSELVFERGTAEPKVRIRVYTTINPWGDGRAKGSDAGRVVLVGSGSNRPLWSAKRVHRTKGFLDNLLERCREAWHAASSLQRCPDCGAFMTVRESKRSGDKFLGCSRYPECRGTRNYNGR